MASQQRLTKLFVAKFGQGTSYKELEDAFNKFGDIYDCRLNERSNYATVCYRSAEHAEKAIQKLNGAEALGGTLLVEYTLKKNRYEGNNDSRSDRYNNGYRDRGDYSRDRDDRRGDRGDYGRERSGDYGRGERSDYGRGGDYRDRDYGRSGYGSRDYHRGGDDYPSRGGRYQDDDRSYRGGRYENDRYRGGERDRHGDDRPYNRNDGDRDRNARQCFNCKETGHIARFCQKPRGREGDRHGGDRSRSRSQDRLKNKADSSRHSRSRSPHSVESKDARSKKDKKKNSPSSSSRSRSSNSRSRDSSRSHSNKRSPKNE